MTTSPLSRQSQLAKRQHPLLAALKTFWEFSNFYGEYNTIAPKDQRNYIESLAKQPR